MTKAEFQEWKQDRRTQEVFQKLYECEVEAEDYMKGTIRAGNSYDRAAYYLGLADGIQRVHTIEFEDDEEESNA